MSPTRHGPCRRHGMILAPQMPCPCRVGMPITRHVGTCRQQKLHISTMILCNNQIMQCSGGLGRCNQIEDEQQSTKSGRGRAAIVATTATATTATATTAMETTATETTATTTAAAHTAVEMMRSAMTATATTATTTAAAHTAVEMMRRQRRL